jgi:hypothetical protein
MIFKKNKKFGSVLVGICSGNMGRYREFDACLSFTISPPGSKHQWAVGGDPAYNLNRLIEAMEELECDYLWILGDDHVWKEDLLMKLLERDKDIVVPLCLRHGFPFWHVIHFDSRRDFYRVPYHALRGRSGCIDITGLTVGNAGMLIKSKVLQNMARPWFECGRTHTEVMGTDLYFCEKAAKAGFGLWLDTDNTIGHIIPMAIWPEQGEDGAWLGRLEDPSMCFPKNRTVKTIHNYEHPEGKEEWLSSEQDSITADAAN